MCRDSASLTDGDGAKTDDGGRLRITQFYNTISWAKNRKKK